MFFICTTLLSMSVSSFSQQGTSSRKLFLRIFDGKNKKILAGFLEQTTDSSLFIIVKKNSVEVLISGISTIKLRRAMGHTILLSSLIGGVVYAIFGATSSTSNNRDDQSGEIEIDILSLFEYTAMEGAIGGFILGGGSGVLVGSIIGGTKSRPVYLVNQNPENWKKIRAMLDATLPAK